jgi:hypothetical protein
MCREGESAKFGTLKRTNNCWFFFGYPSDSESNKRRKNGSSAIIAIVGGIPGSHIPAVVHLAIKGKTLPAKNRLPPQYNKKPIGKKGEKP